MTDVKVFTKKYNNFGQWMAFISMIVLLSACVITGLYSIVTGLILRAETVFLVGAIIGFGIAIGALVSMFIGMIIEFSLAARFRPIIAGWILENYPGMFTADQATKLADHEYVYINNDGVHRDKVKLVPNPAGDGQVLEFTQVSAPRLTPDLVAV